MVSLEQHILMIPVYSNLVNATIELLDQNPSIINLTSSVDLLPVTFAKKTFKMVNLLDFESRFTTYSDEDFPRDFQKLTELTDKLLSSAGNFFDAEEFKRKILGLKDGQILPERLIENNFRFNKFQACLLLRYVSIIQ